MFKIILSTIVSLSFSFTYGSVLKTGQIQSYNENGNVVTNGSVKDDGYYQAGKARSYTRSSTEVVKDNVTGLEWQDNVYGVQKNWDEAQTYCNNLSLDGNGWRLPRIEELENIIDFGQKDPSVTNNIFQNMSGNGYWSSTTQEDNNSYVWDVGFYDGNSNFSEKAGSMNVMCVRGNTVSSNFARDDNKSIVKDNVTGLEWQDDEWAVYTEKTWTDAINYCENLSLGEYNDWRLPNIMEMLSIVDRSKKDVMMPDAFININSVAYWTSTTYINDKSSSWIVNFYGSVYSGGLSNAMTKTSTVNVRCVRGGEFAEPSTQKDAGLISILSYLLF